MTLEAHFEPFDVEQLHILLGGDTLYLDGEIECGTEKFLRKEFQRWILLRKDLVLGQPRAVLKGDTLTIQWKILGVALPGPSSPVRTSTAGLKQLPIIRIS